MLRHEECPRCLTEKGMLSRLVVIESKHVVRAAMFVVIVADSSRNHGVIDATMRAHTIQSQVVGILYPVSL